MSKPLERIFDYKGSIPFKITNKYNFDNIQKSEMIKEEIIEDGFLFRCIAIERNDIFIIIKQEVINLKTNKNVRLKPKTKL